MARLRFSACFFALCAALALHAQPENRGLTLGPEIWAGEPEFVGATAFEVAAASNGDDFLVLWAGSEGIHAQRIAADGTPTTRHGTMVPGATAGAHGIAVDSTGDGYLVVWRQNHAIWSALIPDDRSAVIESRLVLEPGNSVTELVASNDGYLLVVMQGHELRGMLLDERGQSASALFAIASGAAMNFGISGASDGTDYMLTYTISGLQGGVYSQRVTATGEVGFANRLTQGIVSRSLIGHNGTSYVLVWIQYSDEVAPRGVYLARLDPYGLFIDSPQHIGIIGALGLMDDASAVLLEHENERGLLRLTASGAPAGVPVVIGHTPSISAFAASRTHYLLFVHVLGYVVTPRSLEHVSSPRDVATSPRPHSDVRVFSAGQMNVVLWLEQMASDELHIYASRIAHGRPLDGRGLLVSRHKKSLGSPLAWMAASDDHQVLVAWVEATEVRGALIGAGGLATQTFPLMAVPPEFQRAEFHSLVWTGTYYALLWSTAKSSEQRTERIQHFRLFTATGVFVSDGTFAPQVGCNDSRRVGCNTSRVARTADGVLLIYSRDGDIFAAPLRNDLSPAGSPVLVAGTASGELQTAVASDGSGRVFIGWSVGTRVFDHPAAPLSYTYFFRILDARGVAVSDAVSVAGSPFDAVWIGDSFLASLLGPAIIRITRDGRLMDPPAGSLGGRGDYRPVLAHGPAGTVVAYAGSTTAYGVGDSRVAMIRTILDGGPRRRIVRF